MVNRTTDLLATVVVDRRIISETQQLDERLSERRSGIGHEIQHTGDGENFPGGQLGLMQARPGRALPAQGTADLATQLPDYLINGDVQRCRLEAGVGPLVGELDELRTEQRVITRPAPHPDDARRGLSETFAPPRDRHHDDRLPIDIDLMQRVTANVPRCLHGAMDVVLGAGVQRASCDRPVVAHADQQHATVSVGERHRAVLRLLLRDAALELNVFALARKRCTKLRQAQR